MGSRSRAERDGIMQREVVADWEGSIIGHTGPCRYCKDLSLCSVRWGAMNEGILYRLTTVLRVEFMGANRSSNTRHEVSVSAIAVLDLRCCSQRTSDQKEAKVGQESFVLLAV